MLHYNPRHVSSSTMLIFRRSYCIITASGIVTVCKRLYSMPVEGGVRSHPAHRSCRENQNTNFTFNNVFPKVVPFMR